MYNVRMNKLPETYAKRMHALLQDAYEDYIASFSHAPTSSLRINTAKISPDHFQKLSQLSLERVPWCASGFYYDPAIRPGTLPYYYAGLYYLQEASAMAPAEILPVEEGDVVLDACCAPGGKSTALAAKLKNTGLLVANDISASRQNATLKNIERAGFANIYVIAEDIKMLSRRFAGFFDKILLDAPCSGEGMFRKDPSLIQSWLANGPEQYSALQKELIVQCFDMLKPGGKMVYSTCTFSPVENEDVALHLLHMRKDARILPIEKRPSCFAMGIRANAENCARLYPHLLQGEGHFACLIGKDGASEKHPVFQHAACLTEPCASFLKECQLSFGNTKVIKDKVYSLPSIDIDTSRLRVIRSGLLLGSIEKKRFEPSQALAFHLDANAFTQSIRLAPDDLRVRKYLCGETIVVDSKAKGWVLVCLEDYPLGFGKIQNGVIKNKIEKNYRIL